MKLSYKVAHISVVKLINSAKHKTWNQSNNIKKITSKTMAVITNRVSFHLNKSIKVNFKQLLTDYNQSASLSSLTEPRGRPVCCAFIELELRRNRFWKALLKSKQQRPQWRNFSHNATLQPLSLNPATLRTPLLLYPATWVCDSCLLLIMSHTFVSLRGCRRFHTIVRWKIGVLLL